MLNTGLSPWPSFTEEEITATSNVLRSNKVNYWTGQEGREFEKEFAAYHDCKYGIALANGTVALDLCLHALGITDGDEVIVTSRTFLASVSSIVFAGAIPVFADVDRDTQNITAETIAPHITDKTAAIICVHLAGWPSEMDAIMALADAHNIKVIEDCAQAHGAVYKGKKVGSLGHMAAWSFCQDKIMTTGGEGGMVTTNDEALWRKAWSYKDHGKSYKAVYETDHPPGFRWLHESFGTNWRMTEMQSVIGRIQTARMDKWKATRQQYAATLDNTLEKFSCIRIPVIPEYIQHAQYKHYVFVEKEQLSNGWDRDRIIAEIVAEGCPCFSGSCSEVYLEKAFDGTDWRPKKPLLMAKELGETSLMFLVHPTLTKEEVNKMCSAIHKILQLACKP